MRQASATSSTLRQVSWWVRLGASRAVRYHGYDCEEQKMTETTGAPTATPTGRSAPLRFAWLEITGKCQLECVH